MEICGIVIKPYFFTNEFDNYTEKLKTEYNIIGFIDGHIHAGFVKNPIWVINDNYQIFLLMLCSDNGNFTKLCTESYKKILNFEMEKNSGKKLNWSMSKQIYIYCSTLLYGPLTIHQIIMNLYRHENRDLSVDHIDRNPLNNTFSNLRIATCIEQNNNQKGVIPGTKRERQYQARELPEGIHQNDMPKYVTYNINVWDKDKNKQREFFRIEGHPLLYPKVWEGTKSSKIPIHEKLMKIKKILQDLDNHILPTYVERELPKHVYFSVVRGHPALFYNNYNTRHTKKLSIKDENFDIKNDAKRNKYLYILNHWIVQKYGDDETILPDDYQYCGEPINEKELYESTFQLPKYVFIINERGKTILSYQRLVNKKRWSKKMNLRNHYPNLDEPTNELIEEIEITLPLLNKEIIKKYGKEYSVLPLSDEKIQEIVETINIEKKEGLPKYVHMQSIKGTIYLVFSKKIDKKNISIKIKITDNYKKNEQLFKLNQKIIELCGEQNALDLTEFCYVKDEIIIPENLYVVLTSKTPYLYIMKNTDTIIHVLPFEYELQKEIDTFYNNQESYSPTIKLNYEMYKQNYHVWKPNHLSLTIKNRKPILLYKQKTETFSHYLSVYLPDEKFNMYFYLLQMNEKIINKYGNDYNLFCIK